MNFPSDTIQGSPNFHTKIVKVDGGYRATTDIRGVEPVTAPSESQAILAARAAVEAFFGGGGK